jgi:predicted nucleotidyltransferase
MGRGLSRTALTLGCSERTLRRYASDGLLRGRRLGPKRLELPADEEAYAHAHWPVLSGLRRALRTERDVRLAVLFGSMATGDDDDDSDVDVFVVHRRPNLRGLMGLQLRLSHALDRRVQVVSAERAQASPSLLADVLDEGRVLLDRDGRWSALLKERDEVRAAADLEQETTARAASQAIAAARARL